MSVTVGVGNDGDYVVVPDVSPSCNGCNHE